MYSEVPDTQEENNQNQQQEEEEEDIQDPTLSSWFSIKGQSPSSSSNLPIRVPIKSHVVPQVRMGEMGDWSVEEGELSVKKNKNQQFINLSPHKPTQPHQTIIETPSPYTNKPSISSSSSHPTPNLFSSHLNHHGKKKRKNLKTSFEESTPLPPKSLPTPSEKPTHPIIF